MKVALLIILILILAAFCFTLGYGLGHDKAMKWAKKLESLSQERYEPIKFDDEE